MGIATLDRYVQDAIDLFERAGDYTLPLPQGGRVLVVGSQSGYWTGVQLFRSAGRCFSHAKEVNARYAIDTERASLDAVVLVSATGSRQMRDVAEYALSRWLPVYLIVCKPNSEVTQAFRGKPGFQEILVAGMATAPDEPPTINTATYGRMLQGVTHEDPAKIRAVIRDMAKHRRPVRNARALTVAVSDRMEAAGEMIGWKINGEIIARQAGGIAKYVTNLMHGAFVV